MRQDERGNLWFVSRKKHLIIRGASNISPVEVERVLMTRPAVRDAAVIGVPDPELGQRVAGFVQLASSAQSADPDEILVYLTGRLADYKVPSVSRSSMKFPGTLPVRSIANRCRRCEQIFQIYPSRNIAESTGIAGRFWCLTSSSDWSPGRVGSCVQELKKQFGLRLRQLGQQTAGLQKLFQIGT
jgi:hypothetical protein